MSNPVADSPGDEPTEYPYAARKPEFAIAVEATPQPNVLTRLSPLVIAFAGFFAIGNLALVPLMRAFQERDWGAIWVFLDFGALLAQAGLLSFALVFGSGHYWRRLTLHWLSAGFLWCCWAAGVYLANRPSADTIRLIGLSLPLIALGIQSPLWLCRLYLGWRLVRPDGTDHAARPLSISDYMAGTTIVALSVSAARLAPSAGWRQTDYWPAWGIFLAVSSGISLVSVIPAMLLMFWIRNGLLGTALFTAYALSATLLVIATVTATTSSAGVRAWEVLGVSLIFISFATLLAMGLRSARRVGFVLACGRTR